MDQNTQGAPDVNNDGITDSAATPVSGPVDQPAPATDVTAPEPPASSEPAAPTTPPVSEPAPTPAQPVATESSPGVTPASAAPHKSNHTVLFVLVAITVLVLAAAAYFALAA